MTGAIPILLAACIGSNCDFDAVSAWVTGTKFARGANRSRKSPPPGAVARFVAEDGSTNDLELARVDWMGRHYVERIFTAEEKAKLAGSHFVGVELAGATGEDRGAAVSGARLFAIHERQLAPVVRPRRNLAPIRGQDVGVNTGRDLLPFPISEKTILPRSAASKPSLAMAPRFDGGAANPAEAPFLEKRERREGRTLTIDLFAPPGRVTEITLGFPHEAAQSKPLRIPYLPYGDLRILDGRLFRYAAPDWYRSNASEIAVDATDGTVRMR